MKRWYAAGLLALVSCASPSPSKSANISEADLSGPGSYAVFQAETTARTADGSFKISVCAPSSDGGRSISAGPFATIVISPGFQLGRSQYASYCKHLASWGYFAVSRDNTGGLSPNHARIAKQTSSLITWLASSAWASSLDMQKIGLTGHSLGGKTSLLAAADDPRIKALVAWDPVDKSNPSVTPERMPNIKAPLLLLGETNNASGGLQPCAPAADNYQQYFQHSVSKTLEVTFTKGDHMDFVDNPDCFVCGFCPNGGVSDQLVKQITRRTTLAWFNRWLRQDSSMEAYLTGAVMQGDVQAGTVGLRTKN
jgi:dienelactone hydrolase